MIPKIPITHYLKNDSLQRCIYGALIILWFFVGINYVMYRYTDSTVYFDIFYAMVIPPIILGLPIIFNKTVFWLLAFVFVFLHAIWTTYKITFSYLVFLERDYVPGSSKWIKNDIRFCITLIAISFLVT